MNSLEIVSPQRLYRLIADQIAAKISAGEFAPGARLPAERELADKLQVSRSSIREALIALEIGGYVEIRVGSGVFVARPLDDGSYADDKALADSAETAGRGNHLGAFELLETRMLIEPECAALAAQYASDQQIATMREHYHALSNSNTPSHHDRAFHAAIAQACGNAALEAVVAHVWDLSESSVVFGRLDEHMVTSDVWQLALVEHGRVLAAIEEHDPVRARHEMHGHLIGILARLRKDFASADMAEPAISKRPSAWESAPQPSGKASDPQGKTVRARRPPSPR
jgi:DNA-binding FadR family transcriptional regulator